MAREVASEPLLERLAEPGFRASVITTYNCYFPFFEEVVLRRLVAAGCTHNVLLMDADRCADLFSNEAQRPRRAGRDYTLIPVRIGGAFHPKLFLRLGKSKASLFVGSHNMTLSGFGLNDEVTNVFQLEEAALRNSGGPVRSVLEYLAQFVPSTLPEVVDSFEHLRHGLPWTDGPLGAGDPDRELFLSPPSGPELWSRILSRLPSDVSRVFICAPFFDPKLTFVQRVIRDVRPRELVIGIDPASSEVNPRAASALAGVRWVNVAGIPQIPSRRAGSSHYLHAKILWFAGKKGSLLVTGSANPSVAAFLAPSGARNAEAVIADRRAAAGAELGIDALITAPSITPSDWAVVTERRANSPVIRNERRRRVWIATPTSNGFRSQDPLPAGTVLCGLADNGRMLGDVVVGHAAETMIEATETIRDGAATLEARTPDEHLLIIIHRPADLARHGSGDTGKALRQVLHALEEDPGQLEALLKLTEKVIFDSDDVVRASPLRSAGTPDAGRQLPPPPTSLALDAGGRRVSRRRGALASGDIVVLLDALLRRIGEGLHVGSVPRPRPDEAEIDSDDEDGGDQSRLIPELEALAKQCRSKVRRLVTRMDHQLELASGPAPARRSIIQLAAVLLVVRTLRLMEKRTEWRKKHLELVEQSDEWRLFEGAVRAVVWGQNALAAQAVSDAGGEGFDELSQVIGLLGSLGWEIGVDIEMASRRDGLQGVEDDTWYEAQLFGSLGPWFVDDEMAWGLLENSVVQSPRYRVDGDHWLFTHRQLLARFATIAAEPDSAGKSGRSVNPGDLVVLGDRFHPRVRVVLAVRSGGDGDKLDVFDPETESLKRTFISSRVASLSWSNDHGARVASA